MPSASGAGASWASPTARCSAICGTRSATTTGTGWSRDGGRLDEFRAVFGDEREDYGEALEAPLRQRRARRLAGRLRQQLRALPTPGRTSPRPGRTTCTSSTRWRPPRAFRLRVDPSAGRGRELAAEVDFDVYRVGSIEPVVDAWLPLSFAVNSLNRSMGQPDLYPFVLSPAVIEKLGYMQRLLRESRQG